MSTVVVETLGRPSVILSTEWMHEAEVACVVTVVELGETAEVVVVVDPPLAAAVVDVVLDGVLVVLDGVLVFCLVR